MNKEQLKEAVGELNLVDTVFESDGASYIDTAVSVTQVYDLIDQLDRPGKVEPLVVPKELSEWLCCQKLGNEGNFFSIIIELEDMWSGSGFEEFITDNKKQLIEVIIGNRGYEVEKEKLYYILLGVKRVGQSPVYLFKSSKGRDIDWSPSRYIESEKYAYSYRFTESEIKAIDERYWPFAVEVAE